MPKFLIRDVCRWAAAFAALLVTVAAYHRWAAVNPTTVALTLLLIILVLASRWGLRYAVVLSVAATGCYNYYFLPPLHTFTIVDPQNWLALFAFLFTAVVASRLSDQARQDAQDARTRQLEVEILYRLGRELLQTENVAELMASAPHTLAHVSGAASALIYLAEADRAYSSDAEDALAASVAELQQLVRRSHVAALAEEDGEDGVAVPLRSGVRPQGVLVLRGLHVSDATLEAIGGLVSISIDRAQALEEVTRSEAAKSSEQLRSMMLDSITHELRTPLTAIKASATTLLGATQAKRAMAEEDHRDLLLVINEESDRLNHLVAQAVEMAQLDTHDVHMSMSARQVASLIQSAMNTCDSILSGRDAQVAVPDNLPLVLADPAWIQKVMANLLENAVKYSPVTADIRVEAGLVPGDGLRDEYVAISVTDRGSGIDSSEHALIFDKFYRGRNRPRHVPGTGMGLAICRAIVAAHGGALQVRSQPGQGATFTFTLPVAAQQPRNQRSSP